MYMHPAGKGRGLLCIYILCIPCLQGYTMTIILTADERPNMSTSPILRGRKESSLLFHKMLEPIIPVLVTIFSMITVEQ